MILFALAMFCSSIVLLVIGTILIVKLIGKNFNIADDLKKNGQIEIIVYRMTKMTQPTGFDIYNRRGEIIKKKYLLDRII